MTGALTPPAPLRVPRAAAGLIRHRHARLDSRMDGRMDGRLDSHMDGRMDSRMDERMDGRMNGRLDSRMDGRMDGRLDSRMAFTRLANQASELRGSLPAGQSPSTA
ncbi:hypothetical protein [Desulfovibrio sp.]|uniref:hypothetical protein n=1 Tax=Desulfovibrio sp. TaxID=885 RepID=UPI003D0CDCBA